MQTALGSRAAKSDPSTSRTCRFAGPGPRAIARSELRASWARKALHEGVHLVTDGLASFAAAGAVVAEHGAIIVSPRQSSDLKVFEWVNTFIANLKTAIGGTYHHFDFKKYGARYLAEAQYRVNRRFELRALVAQLLWTCARTAPCSEDWLRLGIVRAS